MVNIVLPGNDTVQDWTKFIAENQYIEKGESVNYDLRNIVRLRPHHLVTLACLIESHSTSVNNRYLLNLNDSVKAYLLNIGFTDYFDRKKDRPIGLIHSENKSTLNLWKLRPEMINMYPVEAQRFYEGNAFKGKDLHALNTTLSEILNNFVDHTESTNFGFTATQFFENQGRLETAVCDFGGGIPSKVNAFFSKNNKEIVTNEQALRWAMQIGNSTQSTPRNRGFGLDTLSSLIKKLKGELRIVTNQVVLIQKGNEDFQINSLSRSFPGTLITVVLDITYLSNKEDFSSGSEELF